MKTNWKSNVKLSFILVIAYIWKANAQLASLTWNSCNDYPTCKLVSPQMFEKYCDRSTLKNMCPTYCNDKCKPMGEKKIDTVSLRTKQKIMNTSKKTRTTPTITTTTVATTTTTKLTTTTELTTTTKLTTTTEMTTTTSTTTTSMTTSKPTTTSTTRTTFTKPFTTGSLFTTKSSIQPSTLVEKTSQVSKFQVYLPNNYRKGARATIAPEAVTTRSPG